MCWSAIARPGTSPCVTADAAPTATAPIAAPMAAAIPRDIIRHLHLVSGCRRVRPLWYGHRRYNFGNAGEEAGHDEAPPRHGAFLLKSVEVDGRHRLQRRDSCKGSVRAYGLPVETSAARRSATLLILSRKGAIFDRSDRLRSSRYDAYPSISFSMSSTVCGFRPGIPNGHSTSSFAFAVSS